MAIFHYSVKSINRSSGRSSVAAAAYRAGERLVDARTGAICDYERREGMLHAEVFLPDGEKLGRAELWNLVEGAEKRKDAKVAREIVVALPHELDESRQEKREKAIESAKTCLLWAQRYEKQWREQHPYKSMLFDAGLPNRELGELGELVGNQLEREVGVEKAEKALSEFKAARSQAEK